MTDSEISDAIAEEMLPLVLDGIESPSVRRVLERLVREEKLQRACILKEMYLEAKRLPERKK